MNTDNNKKPLPVRNELVVGGILETAEEAEDRKMRDMDSAPATAATAAATTNGKKQKQTAGTSRGLRRNEEELQAKRKALQEQQMAHAAIGTRGAAISKLGAVPSRNNTAQVFAGRSTASTNAPSVLNQGETPPQESPSLAASRDNNPIQQTPPPTNPASVTAHESSGIGDTTLGGSSSYRPADSVMPTEITDHPEERGVVSVSTAKDNGSDHGDNGKDTTSNVSGLREVLDLARQWDADDKRAKAVSRAGNARNVIISEIDSAASAGSNTNGEVLLSCAMKQLRGIEKNRSRCNPNNLTVEVTQLCSDESNTPVDGEVSSSAMRQLRGICKNRSLCNPANNTVQVTQAEAATVPSFSMDPTTTDLDIVVGGPELEDDEESNRVDTVDMEAAVEHPPSTTNMATPHVGLVEAMPVDDSTDLDIMQAHRVDPKMLETDEVKKRQERCFKRVAGAIIIASVLVVIITVAATQSKKDIPLEPSHMPSLSPSGSPSLAPTALLQDFILSLPNYTLESLEYPWSPQSLALDWLEAHPRLLTMPEWKKKQLFVLVTFYHSFGGDDWLQYATDKWVIYDTDECYWFSSEFGYFDEEGHYIPFTDVGDTPFDYYNYNVTPCNEEGRFEHLVLNQLGLNATAPTVPREINMLTDLLTLDLGENNVTANLQEWLPTELFEMTQLEVLGLWTNSFTGQIPTEVGLLTSLSTLLLFENSLTGSLPSELFLLTALVQFWIFSNTITGSLPTEIGLLTKMTDLVLLSNTFTGSLPLELGLLTPSVYLQLNQNELSGALPTEIGLLTNLWLFSINSNSLTGPIPTELGLWTQVSWEFRLDRNLLTGPIPSELGLLSNTPELRLFGNSLTGLVPSELGLMTMLEFLGLNDLPYLLGSIPTELLILVEDYNLTELNASRSYGLTGTIPSSLCSVIDFDCGYLLCGCNCSCKETLDFL